MAEADVRAFSNCRFWAPADIGNRHRLWPAGSFFGRLSYAYWRPNLGAAEVFTITRNNYVKDCPNIRKFFENLEFSSEIESEVIQQIEDGVDFEEAGANI